MLKYFIDGRYDLSGVFKMIVKSKEPSPVMLLIGKRGYWIDKEVAAHILGAFDRGVVVTVNYPNVGESYPLEDWEDVMTFILSTTAGKKGGIVVEGDYFKYLEVLH